MKLQYCDRFFQLYRSFLNAGRLSLFVCQRVKTSVPCYTLCKPLTAPSQSLSLCRPRRHGAAMPGSLAYLLTYQLSVNTIRERRRDTPRDRESNEKSKGEEEGGRGREAPSHTHLNVQNHPSTPSPFFSPTLVCTLQLPVCCCYDNLPVGFSSAVILCRYGRKKRSRRRMDEGREGSAELTELIGENKRDDNEKGEADAQVQLCETLY